MQNRVGFKHLEKRWRCSVVEEPQAGVHQSDALLITGIDHNLVSSRARWSCDVLNTTPFCTIYVISEGEEGVRADSHTLQGADPVLLFSVRQKLRHLFIH